jgi:hypothetical protein
MKTTRNTRRHGGRGESRSADRRGWRARAARFDWHVVALTLLLVLVGLVRLRLLATPFERDEGEYAYMGRLILDGGLPYRDA